MSRGIRCKTEEKSSIINGRSETLKDKPLFKKLLPNQRCVVCCEGYVSSPSILFSLPSPSSPHFCSCFFSFFSCSFYPGHLLPPFCFTSSCNCNGTFLVCSYYEWVPSTTGQQQRKQPYFFHLPNQNLIMLAGLFDVLPPSSSSSSISSSSSSSITSSSDSLSSQSQGYVCRVGMCREGM